MATALLTQRIAFGILMNSYSYSIRRTVLALERPESFEYEYHFTEYEYGLRR